MALCTANTRALIKRLRVPTTDYNIKKNYSPMRILNSTPRRHKHAHYMQKYAFIMSPWFKGEYCVYPRVLTCFGVEIWSNVWFGNHFEYKLKLASILNRAKWRYFTCGQRVMLLHDDHYCTYNSSLCRSLQILARSTLNQVRRARFWGVLF